MVVTKKVCDFCDNIENRARTVYRLGPTWSFLSNTPITPGHTLICPVRCVATMAELDALEVIDIFCKHLAVVQGLLVEVFDAEGFDHGWNQNEVAGQTVPHLHLHVVPRVTGDIERLGYDPRQFLYRPGFRKPSPQSELEEVAQKLRRAFLIWILRPPSSESERRSFFI